ncbi:MAG: saccharopine dehydrogenase NADP-binding domain-containing protein [Candidatus Marinimicrobia bacterium]|nr:saccharopine dehydrogenase NADP-binding domain-containing protein [Candidatus Neomarinimicrobiota bacterium]
MKKIVVLGAGMVGRAIALDMKTRCNVTVVDINPDNLNKLKQDSQWITIKQDVTEKAGLERVISDADLVISAVPGSMGFETLRRIIESGKNVVDIAFFPEDAFKLDDLARKNNVTAIVDCGVAPGMSNLLLGYHNQTMQVDTFKCFVGGLPVERRWPFEYKAPFSPADVIEEYTRPARFVENGKIVIKEALSDSELINFEKIGTLEAFNTDGLRSLIKTIDAPNMIEKTLRYPGHIDKIRVLKESGFFSSDAINIGGISAVPLEISSQLLFEQWKLGDMEEEFTVMRIIISGKENGAPKTYIYNMLDKFDPVTKISSMARTTGYTCTAAANLFLDGRFQRKGICPPEYIGERTENVKYILDYLKNRNIVYTMNEN